MCYLGFPANAPVAPAQPPAEEASKEQVRQPSPYADEFMMWCFKVVECDNPEHTRDDWDSCPFAHVGEVVTRRAPQTHLPKLCPKARRACRKGRACPYAHNVFEHWLHPSRFKTEVCQHGGSCNRPMCFFAHYAHEVRHPSPSADEVMAAAEAAGLLGRPSSASCGAPRCTGTCGLGGSCGSGSHRSSLTNPDMGMYGQQQQQMTTQPQAAWLAQPTTAPLALQPQVQMQAVQQQQQQLYDFELALAAQCLQQQQAENAAVTGGWPTPDWSMLSSGSSSPRLLSVSQNASPTASLISAATATYRTPSPPGAPVGATGRLAEDRFNLWSFNMQPQGLSSTTSAAPAPVSLGACGAGLPGLTAEETLLLLAGLPQGGTSSYLCALQAEQARLGGAGPSFY